ncbi:NAD(P)-dependent dehydrogenase (short-subunit alcohol dehydrogenase family) [Nocardiopsis arvandica]|jgi:3-oxoacyl-[acyl-carrier protein] reductase|uniref:NAD(P)-dependent dehydrogenase (Short-subunit alcohol dehydrogenase family) n=1 Tax=Nocardiopsis sinuspersici TaxID=501010 RepID=A0A7Z0BLW3_9ACTN|nr:SDR family oxidoreductase [Nocardiopsis sinuspersici]NYH55636.1 NAD(P)-dependent dehydrogenase (short-subunit alcohol dehydrogenase family) [Nocardiopsis sinuspersici]
MSDHRTAPASPPATGEDVPVSRGVLVTGASRGIGRAVATAFAEQGDRVAVHCGSRPQEALRTLEGLPGRGHVLLRADLSDPGAVADLVDRAVEGLGGIDVVVNNAAVNIAHPLTETSYERWRRAWRDTFDVNVFGAADVSYLAARHMIERGTRGHIVNVGSRGAFKGEPDHPAYGASKAALHSLGQSLAVALAPHGITVASVAPGFVETERVADRLTDEVRAQSPFGRVATPGEVASAVRYLASPEAAWSSGAVLDVNGASHLR